MTGCVARPRLGDGPFARGRRRACRPQWPGREPPSTAPRRTAGAGCGRAEIAAFDVTDARRFGGCHRTSSRARHGRLDILVNNAATTVRKPLLEQTDDRLGRRHRGRSDRAAFASRGTPARDDARPATAGSSSLVDQRLIARPAWLALCRREGWLGRSCPRARRRTGAARHHGQRACARLLSDRWQRRDAQRRPGFHAGSPRAFRPDDGASQTNSPPPSCISHRAAAFTTGSVLTVDGGMTVAI